MKIFVRLMLFFGCAMSAFAQVAVISPANNTVVGSSVPVKASAATSCPQGLATMGIYVDNALQRVVDGTNLDSSVSLSPGQHLVVVQGWDYCGGAVKTPLNVTASGSSGVTVASPANGSNVGSPAIYVASATTACDKGVSAMGIYVNHELVYKVDGSTLATPITMGRGQQSTVVQAWDNCGGIATTPIDVNVTGTVVKNVHAAPGWNQWGQLPPIYDICDAPCAGVDWSMTQNQQAQSLSGNATQFYLGGTTPYSDVLFSNPVIGHGNKQGLTDDDHKLMWTLHDFLYDTDIYVSNWAVTQVLEFDVNMYGNGLGMEWGTECNHLNGNVWDYWNNVEARWIPTSIPCTLKDGWNHVTLQVHREANNDLLYQSVTVNGVVYPMNITVAPKRVPSDWWGMTLNYQMDGNYKMDGYTTALDNFHFTYW